MRTGIRIAPDSPPVKGETDTPSYGSFVAYCFSLNYILGVGILSIPWGFVRAGLVLSPLVLVLVSIISYVTANWVLEAMARAQACFGSPADAHHRSESLDINSQSLAYQQLKVNKILSNCTGHSPLFIIIFYYYYYYYYYYYFIVIVIICCIVLHTRSTCLLPEIVPGA